MREELDTFFCERVYDFIDRADAILELSVGPCLGCRERASSLIRFYDECVFECSDTFVCREEFWWFWYTGDPGFWDFDTDFFDDRIGIELIDTECMYIRSRSCYMHSESLTESRDDTIFTIATMEYGDDEIVYLILCEKFIYRLRDVVYCHIVSCGLAP